MKLNIISVILSVLLLCCVAVSNADTGSDVEEISAPIAQPEAPEYETEVASEISAHENSEDEVSAASLPEQVKEEEEEEEEVTEITNLRRSATDADVDVADMAAEVEAEVAAELEAEVAAELDAKLAAELAVEAPLEETLHLRTAVNTASEAAPMPGLDAKPAKERTPDTAPVRAQDNAPEPVEATSSARTVEVVSELSKPPEVPQTQTATPAEKTKPTAKAKTAKVPKRAEKAKPARAKPGRKAKTAGEKPSEVTAPAKKAPTEAEVVKPVEEKLAEVVKPTEPEIFAMEVGADGEAVPVSPVVMSDTHRLVKAVHSGDSDSMMGTVKQLEKRVGADKGLSLTAMVSAIKSGNLETVKLLLYRTKLPINSSGATGHTALMWAAQWGKAGIVDYLLAEGADRSITNKAGKTADRLAFEHGHRSLSAAIREFKLKKKK